MERQHKLNEQQELEFIIFVNYTFSRSLYERIMMPIITDAV